MINYLWGAIFLVAPFLFIFTNITSGGYDGHSIFFAKVISGNDFIRTSRDFVFIGVSTFTLFISGSDRLKVHQLIIFAFILSLSFINGLDFLLSSVFYQVVMFCFGLVFINSLNSVLSIDLFYTINRAIVVASCLFALFVFIELLTEVSYSQLIGSIFGYKAYYVGNTIKGVLNNSNPTGAFLGLSTASFIFCGNFVLLPIIFVALLINGSAMGVLTFTAVFCYYLIHKHFNHKWIITLMFVGMILIYFTGVNGADTHRFKIWAETFDHVGLTIFGKGLGYFYAVMPNHITTGEVVRHAHNEYASTYVNFGLAGLLCLLFLIKKSIENKFLSIAMVGILTNFYGNFTMHVAPTFMLCAFYYVSCIKLGGLNVESLER